ncbi:MAG: glycosyltransferase family 2 protein [Limisphaerales bacterium]
MNQTISVVIPVYNGEKFVTRAINSVFQQTRAVDEIIVVNDGSTDRTLQELESFGDRINVISTPNFGASSARNTGLAASTGSLIAFLDADDEWYPEKIQRQLEFWSRYPHAGICCCDYILYHCDAGELGPQFSVIAAFQGGSAEEWMSDPLKALVRGNFVGTTSTVLMKRDLINEVGLFNTHYKQAEDYDLWIRCALTTEFAILPQVLLQKFSHDRNLTSDYLETLFYHEMVLSDHIKKNSFLSRGHCNLNPLLELAETRYKIASRLFERRDYRKCIDYYLRAVNTQKSAKNVGLFVYYVSRKLARLASFGYLRSRPKLY